MPGYTLTNMVGHVSTRMHRWKSPRTHRSKQMLGPHRVLPNKPVVVSEEVFKQWETVILHKVMTGELMVTTPDGTTITSTHLGELVYRTKDGKVSTKHEKVVEPAPEVEKKFEVTEMKLAETQPIPVPAPAPKVEAKPELKPEPKPEPAPEFKHDEHKGKKGRR